MLLDLEMLSVSLHNIRDGVSIKLILHPLLSPSWFLVFFPCRRFYHPFFRLAKILRAILIDDEPAC